MTDYRNLTEEDIRKIKNEIVRVGQEAIGLIERGNGCELTIAQLIKQQNTLKEVLDNWEEWQKIKDLSFSDLI